MEQAHRIAEFERFKNDEINILVASDVAARGLDVKGVSHVINFDVPWQPDDYIHRIGRTGRAGMTGIAITLAAREDGESIDRIEKLIGHKIPRAGAPKEERPAEKAAEKAAPKPAKTKAAPPKKAEQKPSDQKPAEPPPERSPVVEDIKSDWNGPLPAFLSVSAD